MQLVDIIIMILFIMYFTAPCLLFHFYNLTFVLNQPLGSFQLIVIHSYSLIMFSKEKNKNWFKCIECDTIDCINLIFYSLFFDKHIFVQEKRNSHKHECWNRWRQLKWMIWVNARFNVATGREKEMCVGVYECKCIYISYVCVCIEQVCWILWVCVCVHSIESNKDK